MASGILNLLANILQLVNSFKFPLVKSWIQKKGTYKWTLLVNMVNMTPFKGIKRCKLGVCVIYSHGEVYRILHFSVSWKHDMAHISVSLSSKERKRTLKVDERTTVYWYYNESYNRNYLITQKLIEILNV